MEIILPNVLKNLGYLQISLPDPDVIRGEYWLLLSVCNGTLSDRSNMKNAPIMKSRDLINWTRAGSIFTDATHPQITGVSDAGIWAPTVSKVNGKYIIYTTHSLHPNGNMPMVSPTSSRQPVLLPIMEN